MSGAANDTTAGEGVKVALRLAKEGADKAGCDGWRAQEKCRQIAQLLEQALAAQPSAGAQGEARFQCSTCYRAANPAHFCDRHEGGPWCDECWKVGDCTEIHGEGCHTLFVEDAPATPAQPDTGDVAALREATGGEAVIRGGKIVISIDVDALPMIVSGSCATYRLDGLWKVTDAEAFAKDVCISLNAESENGTTRVHKMFDGAFDHAIDQGAEGIEAITEPEFEVEASRLRLAALSKPNAPGREG